MPAMIFRFAALVLAAASALPATAQPCAGFTDVPAASGFCSGIEWIRNRGVTSGCGANVYCPTQSVTREQMAAFMNRLGNALTPLALDVAAAPGATDLDTGAVLCQSADVAVAGYPRRAYLDGLLSAIAPVQADFVLQAVMSEDGGATWTPLAGGDATGGVGANAWTLIATLAQADLAPPVTVRFGVRAVRGALPGSGDLSDSRCALRVLLHSRTGTASPF